MLWSDDADGARRLEVAEPSIQRVNATVCANYKQFRAMAARAGALINDLEMTIRALWTSCDRARPSFPASYSPSSR